MSAQLYTPAGQSFSTTGAMNVARWLQTATLLNDGTVLIAGGSDLTNEETLDSAEIYSPATGTFTLLSSTLNTARVGASATLLNNGQVLIVGGYDPEVGLISDAELYDPPTQTFIDLGDTQLPRYHHTATILQSGQVLIAGGETDPVPSGAYNTAEIFNPATQVFTSVAAPMTSAREGHAAILLANGQILITGGSNPGTGSLNSAELYDPSSNIFAAVSGTMTTPRISPAATLLNGGQVLIAGGLYGANGPALSSAETYNPGSQTFTAAGNMASAREYQTDTLLNNGAVLIVGGTDGSNIFNTAELYTASQSSGLASITITPANPSIGIGGQQLFSAVGTFGNGTTESLASVLWSSSNTSVASTSNDSTDSGAAATLAQGTATITASAAGVAGSTTFTVTAPSLASISLSPQSSTIFAGTTEQFTATGVYTDGSTQDLTSSVAWSSAGSVAASINSSGLATALVQGVSTIQATYASVSATTNLVVSSPAVVAISINPPSATVASGTTQQFQAIATYSNGATQDVSTLISWSSTATNVATITTAGLAQSTGQGSATITASFDAVSASVTLDVGPPNLVSITISPDAATLSIGSTQQLTATGNYTDGSTQNLTSTSAWAASNSGVLGVNSSGLASASTVGQSAITATFGSTSGTAILIVTSGTIQASLNTSRYLHSTVTLNTGQILVAGGISCQAVGSCTYLNSAELYNPTTDSFTTTGSMAQARSASAVLLNNGNVLIAGGYYCDASGNCSSLSSAELYSPSAGTFSSAGNMTVARSGQTMTLLSDGTVLIAGGETCTGGTCNVLANAEIYDPVAGTFAATSTGLTAARYGATAVSLNSGLVLITGGFNGTSPSAASDIYSPVAKAFLGAGPSLNTARSNATATLLNGGQVLVAGGTTCNLPGCPTNAAEIFDPIADTFTNVPGGMVVSRLDHTATLLTNGQVLVAGGFSSCNSSCMSEASTELFDPVAGVFSSSQSVANALAGQTQTLTANGNALLIGGINAGVTLSNDEWYQPTTLTPPGLLSISVTPSSLFLLPGQASPLVAAGTFSGGNTEILQSAMWSSSNPSVVLVSNAGGNNGGVVVAQAIGTATISATTGNVGGSTALDVAGLVSLSLSPSNPSLTIGTSQQITATGTFTDGSTQNVTSSATWSSSNTAIALVGATPGLQGLTMGLAAGTATITANYGNTSAVTQVTAQAPPAVTPPSIASVSPSAGTGGTQVIIAGAGFGASQGTGTVWLGSTYAAVTSWGNTQIVATVSSIATSGTAWVQQSGQQSNTVSFSVSTATISGTSPSSGAPGTVVTVYGSGFGVAQGGGQVFLGTAPAIVQSWTDGQIVAEVAAGATSGSAHVLQNGVMSNAVPFAVDVLQISNISPNSGPAGTVITINGSGFGGLQGSGTVWLGSTAGEVVSWNDTKVMAVVTSGAVSGVARIEQNQLWSNAVPFTVPANGSTAILNPNILNLMAGQTQNIQALDPNGQAVTGLNWTSSNTAVVSLSTDDPPLLTAISPGHATITAGNSSADVLVYPDPPPAPGTVLWSDPGDGSGIVNIVPAVPSASSVADVFALNGDCNLQAVANDGSVGWTANIGQSPQSSYLANGNFGACNSFLPDFEGGVVVENQMTHPETGNYYYQIQQLDGATGQANPSSSTGGWWINLNNGNGYYFCYPTCFSGWMNTFPPYVMHPNGTVFVLDGNPITDVNSQPVANLGMGSVDVINPATGQAIYGIAPNFSVPYNASAFGGFGNLIIAGDGYAYVPYVFNAFNLIFNPGGITFAVDDCPGFGSTYFGLLRIDTSGNSSWISVGQWANCGNVPLVNAAHVITNADQGVLLTWQLHPGGSQSGINYVTFTRGTTVVSQTTTDNLVIPLVQAQDGTFYGTDSTGANMLHLDQSGKVTWTVPGDSPQIATADNGVIGASGITYDSSGNVTGLMGSMPIQSWTGNAYTDGPVDQVATNGLALASSYWAFALGNASGNSAASPQQWYPPLDSCNTTPGCIGHKQAIYNALGDLIKRLQNPATIVGVKPSSGCSASSPITLKGLAQTCIFNKLSKGGSVFSVSTFLTYLQEKPARLYNGLSSNYCYNALVNQDPCVPYLPDSLYLLINGQSVSQFLTAKGSDAITYTPKNPFLSFFNPNSILFPNAGMNLSNESMLFHEAIHGYTGLQDSTILEDLGNLFTDPTCNISLKIQNMVLIYSSGLPAPNVSCPQ